MIKIKPIGLFNFIIHIEELWMEAEIFRVVHRPVPGPRIGLCNDWFKVIRRANWIHFGKVVASSELIVNYYDLYLEKLYGK